MGVYGEAISTAVPSVGASGTGYATDINALLTEFKTRLALKVGYASMIAGAAPGTGRSVLTVASTNALDPNSAANTITNHVYLGPSTFIKHSTWKLVVPLIVRRIVAGAVNTNDGNLSPSGAAATFDVAIPGLFEGKRILAVELRINKNVVTASSVQIFRNSDNVVTGLGSAQSSITTGRQTIIQVLGSPEIVSAHEWFHVRIVAQVNETIEGIYLQIDEV